MEQQNKTKSSLTPVQILGGSFLGLILLGTILLMLPECHAYGQNVSFLDALFTSTSAVCVTGLTVVDTSTAWSRLGQVVILIMVQLGGIGIVTFGALFALLLGQKINFRQRELLKEVYGKATVVNIFHLIPVVAVTTLVIELVGAIFLLPVFLQDYSMLDSIWHSVFHAVSAFCNAGFSTFSNSLEGYTGKYWLNAVICSLIIVGGIGFPVLAELYNLRHQRKRLSLHSRVVLWSSAVLIAAGALLFMMVETFNNPEFNQLSIHSRILGSLFQSITARTAGFNTIPINTIAPASLFALQFLMIIGGSPSGTAGGIKTTTFVASIAAVKSVLAGRADTILFDRRLKGETVRRAMVLLLLAVLTVGVGFFLMILTSGSTAHNYLNLGFETVSAFGTVGLSTGITSELSTGQRIVIIFLMFIGRLGPMTFALALAKPKAEQIKFAETDLLTG